MSLPQKVLEQVLKKQPDLGFAITCSRPLIGQLVITIENALHGHDRPGTGRVALLCHRLDSIAVILCVKAPGYDTAYGSSSGRHKLFV